MKVEASTCCGANRRRGEQPEERYLFRRSPSPNLAFIPAGQSRTDHQRQTESEEGQRVLHSILPEHMRNVMIANCPVKRVVKDRLFRKHDRDETEDRKKSYRKNRGLDDGIRWRQIPARSITREE